MKPTTTTADEVRAAFPERDAADPGHARLTEALTGKSDPPADEEYKHDPRPWTADGIDVKAGAEVILCMPPSLDHDEYPHGHQNARLAAAAPDLLGACRAALAYLESNRPKGNIRDNFSQINRHENDAVRPLRAAIARAEGGAA